MTGELLPDPAAVAGAGALAWTGRKLLGPLLGDIAEGWRERHERYRTQNVETIIQKAAKISGPSLELEGAVHPRVGQVLFDEGSWCDDSLVQDYLAGVLATSRTPDGGDDQGLTWARQVTRMSSVQIRAHFVVYNAARPLFLGVERMNVGLVRDLEAHMVWIPRPDIDMALGLDDPPSRQVDHAFRGLHAAGLIGRYAIGWRSTLKDWGHVPPRAQVPEQGGVLFALSTFGMELFLWAHGAGRDPVHDFANPRRSFNLDDVQFDGVASACFVQDLPHDTQEHLEGDGDEEGEEE